MGIASVDRKNGRAIIKEGDDTIYTLEYDKPGPIDSTGIHEGLYLQPAMNDITTEHAGEFPYKDFHEKLKESEKQFSALDAVLGCFNKEYLELRDEAVGIAEEELTDQKVYTFVLERVTETPFPKGFSLEGIPGEGKLGEIVKAIKKKWQI